MRSGARSVRRGRRRQARRAGSKGWRGRTREQRRRPGGRRRPRISSPSRRSRSRSSGGAPTAAGRAGRPGRGVGGGEKSQRAGRGGFKLAGQWWWSTSPRVAGCRCGWRARSALIPVTCCPWRSTPRAYGEALGRAIFAGAVRDAFRAARGAGGLRVLLCVEAPDLRPLRWERLCAPRGGRWAPLAFDQRAPLSLYLPSGRPAPLPPHRPARPAGPGGGRQPARPAGRYRLDPFDAPAAAAVARGGRWGTSRAKCWAPRRWRGPARCRPWTPSASGSTAVPYTLLHVVCHGRYCRGRAGRR